MNNAPAKVTQSINALFGVLETVPHSLIAVLARASIGGVFWMSAQTKVSGFGLAEGTVDLFRDEYHLPFIDPTVAAVLAAISEHLFSALLIIGLASRFSALALLGMTLVIQLLVYPGAWATHGTWAVCFLVTISKGPGRISLDAVIHNYLRHL